MTAEEDLVRMFNESIAVVRSSERVRSMIPLVRLLHEEVGALVDIDAQLGPELAAASARLAEVADALASAYRVLVARVELMPGGEASC